MDNNNSPIHGLDILVYIEYKIETQYCPQSCPVTHKLNATMHFRERAKFWTFLLHASRSVVRILSFLEILFEFIICEEGRPYTNWRA